MRAKQPRLTYYHINAPVSPLRIGVLADLHNGFLPTLPDLLFKAKVDMIAIVGDLYEGPPRKEAFAFDCVEQVLEACSQTAPTFYVQGNHDRSSHPQMDVWLNRYHITRLSNEDIAWNGVWIGGITSAYYQPNPTPDLAFAKAFSEREGYKILLCHHPEYYRRYLKDLPIDLILSGHNHGGQWAVLGHGLYVPGQGLFPPHTSGVTDNRLVVSRGLYNNARIPRIGTPTELVVVEIGS